MCRRLVKMLHKGSGVGTYFEDSKKAIRLVNRGCTNRPFYHIVVAEVNFLLNFSLWNVSSAILTHSNRRFLSFFRSTLLGLPTLKSFREVKDQAIEQVGSYDPMLNEHNENLVALNFERIQWWLGEGVKITKPAAQLLGTAFDGFRNAFAMTFIGNTLIVCFSALLIQVYPASCQYHQLPICMLGEIVKLPPNKQRQPKKTTHRKLQPNVSAYSFGFFFKKIIITVLCIAKIV